MTDEDLMRAWLNGCDSIARISDRDWRRLKGVLVAARAEGRRRDRQRQTQVRCTGSLPGKEG